MSVDQRLSVHAVAFGDASAHELNCHWKALGLNRLSLVDHHLDHPEIAELITRNRYTVSTVYHLFGAGRIPLDQAGIQRARAALNGVIDNAAKVKTQTVYLLTGGRGDLTWEDAAQQFWHTIGPCVDHARAAGVALAIENASALYADIHIAHSLCDTITLAELCDLDICVDLFHCWAEAGLSELISRALPRTRIVQISDYVLGDRSLPARAVPGDGVIPIESILNDFLAKGYSGGFDLELIGPRIVGEGALQAAQRGCTVVTTLLTKGERGEHGIR